MSTRIEKAKQATIGRREAEAKALWPDIEKLTKFGEELLAITGPDLKDHEMICFLSDTLHEIHNLGKTCLYL